MPPDPPRKAERPRVDYADRHFWRRPPRDPRDPWRMSTWDNVMAVIGAIVLIAIIAALFVPLRH